MFHQVIAYAQLHNILRMEDGFVSKGSAHEKKNYLLEAPETPKFMDPKKKNWNLSTTQSSDVGIVSFLVILFDHCFLRAIILVTGREE